MIRTVERFAPILLSVLVACGSHQAPGEPSTQQQGLRNQALTVSTFLVTGYSSSATAGVSSAITVTAKDSNGATVTGYIGTVTFSSTDSQAALPSNYTFLPGDNGTQTFSPVTLKTAGTQSITVNDTVTPSITGSQTGIVVSPAAASQVAFTTQPTNTVAGATIAPAVVVAIEDAFGNVVTTSSGNVALVFHTNPGSGTLSGTHTVAAVSGVATFNTLSINKSGTGYSLQASSGSLARANSAAFNITTGPASQVAFLVQPTNATAGVTISPSPVVAIQDANGNTVTTSNASITITIQRNPSGGTLSGTVTQSASSGLSTFNGLSINRSGIGYTLRATAVGISSTATTSAFTITPGAATSLLVSGFPSVTVAGVAQSVTVTAQDSFGNATPNYTGTVTFSSSDGAAVLPANYSFGSGDVGTHTFSAVTLSTLGTQSISATDTVTNSINGTESGISVISGASAVLSVSGFPSPSLAGASHNLVVTAQDGSGNTLTGYVGTVHFTSTDPHAVLPADYTFVGSDSGTHTFSVSLGTVGSQSITVTDIVTSTVHGSQSGLVVSPGSAAKLAFSVQPTNTVAGTSISPALVVLVEDASGNVVITSSATVTLDFAANPGSATLSGTKTGIASSGTATFNDLSVDKAASGYTLEASSSGLLSVTSSTFDVSASATSSLSVLGFPSSSTAGDAHAFTVSARDADGNLIAGYTGTVHFSSSDPQASLPADYTFVVGDNGSHDFSATFKTSGSQSITATDTVTSAFAGAQTGLNVVAASAASLSVSGFITPDSAGISHPLTVTAKDSFGNTSLQYLGRVHFTSSDSHAVLPTDYTFTATDNGAHAFDAILKTSGVQSISATDLGTPTITGAQTGITVRGRSGGCAAVPMDASFGGWALVLLAFLAAKSGRTDVRPSA